MAKTSSCTKRGCGTTVDGTVGLCPTCGSMMRPSGGVRMIGCVVFFLGLFFAGAFGAIMVASLPTMLDPEAAIANKSAQGKVEQLNAIRLLFLSVFFAGLVFLFFGFRILTTGRPVRNLALFALIALLPILWTAYGAYKLMPQKGADAASLGDDR
jgi:hypothetical protein